jgi:CRP-like cAMP-binding protein
VRAENHSVPLEYFNRLWWKVRAHSKKVTCNRLYLLTRGAFDRGGRFGMRLSCFECRLRTCGLFKPVSRDELAIIDDIKREHLAVPAGTEIIRADEENSELYTLYAGWAFRFKVLPDGRRQILNFLLPGDLLKRIPVILKHSLHG